MGVSSHSASAAGDLRIAAGADVGATLVKLAVRQGDGRTTTEAMPIAALDRVAEKLGASGAERVGLTGGGAARLADRVSQPVVAVGEFEAWAAGARTLLARGGSQGGRFLLVSVGTGTSAMRVEPGGTHRVGGTALGGGTVMGLAAGLLGLRDFDAVAELAAQGDRRRVDLMVSDIYPHGDFTLPGDLNAASFAKLAGDGAVPHEPADVAHAIMGLVGENVGLICGGLARQHGVERVVFGGSTLRANEALCTILGGVCLAVGARPEFLPEGQYAGALGALASVESDALAG